MINKKEIFTKSNQLSFFRLLLAIPLWILLDNIKQDESVKYLVFSLCLFASFTDILDGYLARKFNEVTEFGKIIDPLADKITMAAVILKLYLIDEIPAYYLFMILGRDLIIFTGGIFVSSKLGKVLPSNVLGKITVIIIGIVILLIVLQVGRSSLLFQAFYGLSIFLIFTSLIAYFFRALEFLKQKNYESV